MGCKEYYCALFQYLNPFEMKTKITLCLLLFTVILSAQRMIDVGVGDFDEIKVFDLIEVNLIQADENKIVIKGERTKTLNGPIRMAYLNYACSWIKNLQGKIPL